MQCSAAWRLTSVIVSLGCLLGAQVPLPSPQQAASASPVPPQQPTQTSSVTSAKKKLAKAKPKLTSQQEQGLRLLKSAKAAAAGLSPESRTFILWQVSHGYRKVDPAKADAILRSAFLASRTIEDAPDSADCPKVQVCRVQLWLQTEILSEVMRAGSDKASLERVEKLLPQANPIVKKRMLSQLAHEYVRKLNFDRARGLLTQLDDDEYPYFVAGELMAALPASRRDERLAVFSQAFRNFQNRSLDSVEPNDHDDFGILVIRFGRDFPSLALDAIDSILERTKDRDESRKNHTVTVTLFGGKSLPFGSEYEYRLFQLLPILQELDPSKAEQLLADHDKSHLALDQYPGGMQSLDPNYYGDKPADEKTMPSVMDVSAAIDDDPAINSQFQSLMQRNAQIFGQMQTITDEAKSDPEGAYQDALKLPLEPPFRQSSPPRAVALKRLALAIMTVNSTLARNAMGEARRLEQDINPYNQSLFLAEVPDFYLTLKDEDGARSVIEEQVKIAEKLYAIDSDAGDPNLVFKGAWPSTNGWRNCIKQATKFSSAFAEEILREIPDPDIAGLEQVMYANALMGAENFNLFVVEWHKNGRQTGASLSG